MARGDFSRAKDADNVEERLKEKKRQNKEKRTVHKPGSGLDFRTYIHRVYKVASPKKGAGVKLRPISGKAMTVLNDMCVALLEKICSRSKEVMKNNGNVVFSNNDVNAIFQLIFKGDLGKNAVYESIRANATYHNAMAPVKAAKAEKEKKKNMPVPAKDD